MAAPPYNNQLGDPTAKPNRKNGAGSLTIHAHTEERTERNGQARDHHYYPCWFLSDTFD